LFVSIKESFKITPVFHPIKEIMQLEFEVSPYLTLSKGAKDKKLFSKKNF